MLQASPATLPRKAAGPSGDCQQLRRCLRRQTSSKPPAASRAAASRAAQAWLAVLKVVRPIRTGPPQVTYGKVRQRAQHASQVRVVAVCGAKAARRPSSTAQQSTGAAEHWAAGSCPAAAAEQWQPDRLRQRSKGAGRNVREAARGNDLPNRAAPAGLRPAFADNQRQQQRCEISHPRG